MATLFTKIVNGEIPCYKIAENHRFLAFLDINPLNEGHTLVIPKKEVDYLFDLEDQLLADLMVFAKSVARAIDKSVACERIGVAVIGLEVPHAHIHLVPLKGMGDLNFANPKKKFTQEQFQDTASRIARNLEF